MFKFTEEIDDDFSDACPLLFNAFLVM